MNDDLKFIYIVLYHYANMIQEGKGQEDNRRKELKIKTIIITKVQRKYHKLTTIMIL